MQTELLESQPTRRCLSGLQIQLASTFSLCFWSGVSQGNFRESYGFRYLFLLKSEFDLLMFSANKVVEDFDFGTVLCVREMMKSGKTGKNPDTDWLASNFPQFREMEIKANGTFV